MLIYKSRRGYSQAGLSMMGWRGEPWCLAWSYLCDNVDNLELKDSKEGSTTNVIK